MVIAARRAQDSNPTEDMPGFWMVRAGEGGYQIDAFERASCVGIGWEDAGDFSDVRSIEEARAKLAPVYPDAKPASLAMAANTIWKFRHTMKVGDRVVSYDPRAREYLLGTIVGEYEYTAGRIPDFRQIRAVEWDGRVRRDDLSPSSRNSLGSLVSIFQPGDEVLRDLEAGLRGRPDAAIDSEEPKEELEGLDLLRREVAERAHEFIKDMIGKFSPDEMEELTAAILRAMGFKARVTPKGADRGRDVVASRDGLGLEAPRIVAEVKHRPNQTMGAPDIRGFLGGLREGDRGLYVSTGGFSREARYEAERSNIPIALVDMDDLAGLIVEHYERFDTDARALVPLVKIYWPAS